MNCDLENIMQYMISITHWTSQLLVLSNFNEKKNHKLERDSVKTICWLQTQLMNILRPWLSLGTLLKPGPTVSHKSSIKHFKGYVL